MTLAATESAPAAWAIPDDAGRETRAGWIIIAAFFGIFLVWAALVRVDAGTYAAGSIVVSGSRQVVQHRDGGTVARIEVRDGQRVAKGQVLVVLGGGNVQAAERSLASQVIGLQAERARLVAERNGLAEIPMPPEFAALQGADRDDADRALALQTATLRARRSTVAGQKQVLGQKSAELTAQIRGIEGRITANRRQSQLFVDELASLRSLAGRGFVSINRLRALERAEAALTGETGSLTADIAAARAQIDESRFQIYAVESQNSKDVSESLRTIEFNLNDALPRYEAAKEQLARMQIRSPASGQVVGLKVTTVGSVVAPGDTLMEVVPEDAKLVAEVKVAPEDSEDLAVGQVAEIRIAGMHGRGQPALMGKVTMISADSFVDQRTGQSFFTAQIEADRGSLDRYSAAIGSQRIKAGQAVQVIVASRKRTMLQYLFEPLDQVLWRSFREK